MGWFSRPSLDTVRGVLGRVARIEAARLAPDKLHERGPFSEERLRLLGLFAQDQGLPPAELARRSARDGEVVWDEACRWRAGIDPAAEGEAILAETKPLGTLLRKLVPEIAGFVGRSERFGGSGPVDSMRYQFEQLDAYFAYAPSRRGFLAGTIRPEAQFRGLEMNALDSELASGRYNYDYRGGCDKLWDDLTYVRPAALEYHTALVREVLAGDCSIESVPIVRARALFKGPCGGNLERVLADLEWWTVEDLRARRRQRHQARRAGHCELIDQHSLAPRGVQGDFYWVFDEVLSELEVMLALKSSSDGEPRLRARSIDALIRFEPPASEAAFYYDQRLLLAEAHLAPNPSGRLSSRLRGLVEFEDYAKLMRASWDGIQQQLARGAADEPVTE